MPEGAVVVFTGHPLRTMLEDRGSRSWALDPIRAGQHPYIVCTWNSRFQSADSVVQTAASGRHGAAFLVGRITKVEPSPYNPSRFIVCFNEYAILDSQSVVWPGHQNPVWYVRDIRRLGIEPDALTWIAIPGQNTNNDSDRNTRLGRPIAARRQ